MQTETLDPAVQKVYLGPPCFTMQLLENITLAMLKCAHAIAAIETFICVVTYFMM
jgi:hypothetical protein